VLLDSAEIHIGANVLIGPGVQLLTAFHPLRARDRITPDWTPTLGRSPFAHERRQSASDNGWLGAERS
jgi:acetyltransferase-like isoleucine patch superfamily enzyme